MALNGESAQTYAIHQVSPEYNNVVSIMNSMFDHSALVLTERLPSKLYVLTGERANQ